MVVWFTDNGHTDSRTSFKFNFDKKDSASIENLSINAGGWKLINDGNEIKAWVEYEISNLDAATDVTGIKYTVNGGTTVEVAATCTLGTSWADAAACGTANTFTAGDPATCTLGAAPEGGWTEAACGTANTFTAATTKASDDSYITYDSTTYPDMFRIGMKEDGKKVYVEKTKN